MIEAVVGTISGVITGTGMGGGIILILVLSLFMGIDQHTAQAVNLIFFVPTAVAATVISIKNKLIEWKTATIIVITGTVGSIVGAKASFLISSENLRRYFGIFLAIIAVHEIYYLIKPYISKKKKT